MNDTVQPPAVLRYPGSKSRLAPRINDLLPHRPVYLEPYAGSLAVLAARSPSPVEVVNDLDGRIVRLWQSIRDYPDELARAIECTPYARMEYDQAGAETGVPTTRSEQIEESRRLLVRLWQGHGFKLVGAQASGWRRSLKPGRSHPSEWAAIPERIQLAAERLRRVYLECRDASQLLREFRRPGVAVYADPPYHPDTIADPRFYRVGMTASQHEELLDVLLAHPGPVVLSGYPCRLYDQVLTTWRRYEIPSRADGRHPRTEVLWCNREAQP
jgi:DNA adenine methylase